MIERLTPVAARDPRWTLIDVREYPEHAAGAIAGSRLVPLATVGDAARAWPVDGHYLLVCRSGKRATQAAEKLAAAGFTHLAVMEGGMQAWEQAGLPVQRSSRQPWSLERQVRVVAGALVLIFTVLGLTTSPWFFALTAFVGAGLTVAGIFDFCLMATLLGKMPWNRPRSATPASHPTSSCNTPAA